MLALRTFLALLSLNVVSAMVVIESRPAAPNGFVSQGPAHPSDTLTLRFALAPNNLAGLQEKLASISTPGSSEFRQWLLKDDVKAFVEPTTDTVATFNSFASANGLTPTVISPNGDWVSLTMPVSQANKLFATNFELFTHPELDGTITRTLSVSLPNELVGHVDVVHPTTEFTDPNPSLVSPKSFIPNKRDTPTSCNTSEPHGTITPSCLQDIYGIPTSPATQSNNTLLVTGYVGEWAQAADLQTFLTLWRPDMSANTTFSLVEVDGGLDPQNPLEAGGEANLDIQFTVGIATGILATFLSVGGNGTNAGFATALLDTTTYLDGVDNPPSVMTTSYGSTESSFGAGMVSKICDRYMALGARGISILTASGDGGVRGNHDILGTYDENDFTPVFPATCPYVTAVGSTFGFGPEVAINFTGGGFSNIFPTPLYQTAAVATFLETIPSDFAGTFNATGRGYPDVALQGRAFQIIIGNGTAPADGTSASSPTFASIIALINDRLVAAGKPVLGFLNPFIYSTGSAAFTDILSGHNSGYTCPASSVSTSSQHWISSLIFYEQVAFDAAVGWDPLSTFSCLVPLEDSLTLAV
ncbi:Family S53 protease-like protein [Mycena sanguinolenta]|uniref:tripeptidyl-peptidase II n=1 Tax=Mycena sanguinolenta TaxID=230812 RepID=A0A8H7CX84_9AGAR|nr:Family S53 protease-like protein [Mycena sanguinolenta]